MHRTESISGRQLPQSERPRGRREVCCVPETMSCATPSYSPAGSPVTSYNRKALTPSSERQKAMVLGPTNWLSEEMRGWVMWEVVCEQASIDCYVFLFSSSAGLASWQKQENLANLFLMIHSLISCKKSKADPRIHICHVFIWSRTHPTNDYQWG